MNADYSQNPKIILLDDHTKNQIAAGEVIERPASVVKELVENSIDAGATIVKVYLEDGGRKLIRVIDNGCGMTKEDAILSVQRHATSKIRSADDLNSISTLGFRGEALPSIASVSFMEIETKTIDDVSGFRLRLEGSKIIEAIETGVPNGTKVEVHNLFYNLPVRMKFMRAAQTELGHCAEMLGRLAISRPDISIKLYHNDREILSTTGNGNLLEAIASVYGYDLAKELVWIEGNGETVRLTGFVTKPTLTRATRANQMFYVNNRCARSKIMLRALDDSYRGILPQGRWPASFLFYSVPAELVDVNIHPSKAEVKFARDWEIHSVTTKTIKAALKSTSEVLGHHPDTSEIATSSQNLNLHPKKSLQELLIHAPTDALDLHNAIRSKIEGAKSESKSEQFAQPTDTNIDDDYLPANQDFEIKSLVVLGQIRNLYIIAQSERGIVIIDQHAAHERILFEKLMEEARSGSTDIQRLVIPFTLSLGHRESAIVSKKIEDLKQIGFEIEPFGPGSFVVRSIPARIANKDYQSILRDAIEEMTELSLEKHLIVPHQQMLTTLACKMAVKSGDPLSREEQVALVKELLESDAALTCPHGRPVIVTIENRELDKRFGR